MYLFYLFIIVYLCVYLSSIFFILFTLINLAIYLYFHMFIYTLCIIIFYVSINHYLFINIFFISRFYTYYFISIWFFELGRTCFESFFSFVPKVSSFSVCWETNNASWRNSSNTNNSKRFCFIFEAEVTFLFIFADRVTLLPKSFTDISLAQGTIKTRSVLFCTPFMCLHNIVGSLVYMCADRGVYKPLKVLFHDCDMYIYSRY